MVVIYILFILNRRILQLKYYELYKAVKKNRGIINDIVTLLSEESISPQTLNGFKSLII